MGQNINKHFEIKEYPRKTQGLEGGSSLCDETQTFKNFKFILIRSGTKN